MNASNFDSFDQSELGAFKESTHKARGICEEEGEGDLYVCGNFFQTGTGTIVREIARWDGVTFNPVSIGNTGGGSVNFLKSYAGDLYIGGSFGSFDFLPGTENLVKWDGTQYVPLPQTPNNAVFVLDEFQGDLIIGGRFSSVGGAAFTNKIVGFNGTSFFNLYNVGGGPNGTVLASGNAQGFHYFGGQFTSLTFLIGARRLVRWDGNVNGFSIVGQGAEQGVTDDVDFIMEYLGDLAITGDFTSVSGTGQPIKRIATHDTQMYTQIAQGLAGRGRCMATYNGELYVGGLFDLAGGGPANGLAVLRNGMFQRVGPGIFDSAFPHLTRVDFMKEYQGQLIIGGSFDATEDFSLTNLGNIVAWDGGSFSPLSNGLQGTVQGMEVY